MKIVEKINDHLKIIFDEGVLKLTGKIDDPDPGVYMKPIISQINSYQLKNGIRQLVIDITDLDFLNSSGIKQLVVWTAEISRLPQDNRFLVKFRYSSRKTWQHESVSIISLLNPKIIQKEKV